jgi:hypothetical protein
MPITPWTDEETETALHMYNDGRTFDQIAMTLKRTRSEVAGKLFRERRKGAVIGRIAKNRPPPRGPRNPKPQQTAPKNPPSKPQPIGRIRVSPDHRPHPPRYIPPPEPPQVGPPTIWELRHDSCRYPVGDRDGVMTFCGVTVERGSWCVKHHAVVYTRRA